MIALITIGVFFLLLVMVYPAACTILSLLAALKKRKARHLGLDHESIEEIDQATDHLKKTAFIVSLILTFFVAAPFIALVVIADLF